MWAFIYILWSCYDSLPPGQSLNNDSAGVFTGYDSRCEEQSFVSYFQHQLQRFASKNSERFNCLQKEGNYNVAVLVFPLYLQSKSFRFECLCAFKDTDPRVALV